MMPQERYYKQTKERKRVTVGSYLIKMTPLLDGLFLTLESSTFHLGTERSMCSCTHEMMYK